MPKSEIEQIKEQTMNKCRHFNGLMAEVCDAGVKYADVELRGMDGRRSLPCLKDEARFASACVKCRYPSEEEAEKEAREILGMFDRVLVAREAVEETIGDAWAKGKSVAGTIECPVCKLGNLHYSKAPEGHIHAKCETQGCVSWME